jgi:phospholipase C
MNSPTANVTRRTLLRGAAGGAALVASSRLPAWAKPVGESAAGIRRPDSLPFPDLPAGHPSMPKIEHIVVLMMENHSFDNLLGMVPYQVLGRRHVDGLTRRKGRISNWNPGAAGQPIFAAHLPSPCQLTGAPGQNWNASHISWAHGRNSGFVKASGPVAMAFWDQADLPFTYSLAKHFPIGERYFCSVLAQTDPNRRFLFAGTSSGLVATNTVQSITTPVANGTIFERLDDQGIDWGVYFENVPSYALIPAQINSARTFEIDQFFTDAAAGKLPPFTMLDPDYNTTSEEDPQDIQVGEEFVARVVHALMKAPTWKSTALFINYDEHGGYYDHVPPPPAIAPDSIAPIPPPGNTTPLLPGGFDRYGFRVPLFVVSPWAKANYTSKIVQDHTSVTAFIERKWNLPAMTFRDANAHPMTDYFNFRKPAFMKPPRLHPAPGLNPGLAKCHAQGLNPPLPGQPVAPGDT